MKAFLKYVNNQYAHTDACWLNFSSYYSVNLVLIIHYCPRNGHYLSGLVCGYSESPWCAWPVDFLSLALSSLIVTNLIIYMYFSSVHLLS